MSYLWIWPIWIRWSYNYYTCDHVEFWKRSYERIVAVIKKVIIKNLPRKQEVTRYTESHPPWRLIYSFVNIASQLSFIGIDGETIKGTAMAEQSIIANLSAFWALLECRDRAESVARPQPWNEWVLFCKILLMKWCQCNFVVHILFVFM